MAERKRFRMVVASDVLEVWHVNDNRPSYLQQFPPYDVEHLGCISNQH
jgi:hypothetical protein